MGKDGDVVSRRLIVGAVLVIILSLVIVYGSAFTSTFVGGTEHRFKELGAVMDVIALVTTRHYFQPVSTLELIKGYVASGTINGMLSRALDDPYTRHMDPAAYENMMNNTTGVYGGIGIVVGMQDDGVTVVSPIKGTPGERAGLRRNDKIIAIDGKETTYMTLDEAVGLMRGEPNTVILLTIRRDEEVFDVEIIRETINVVSVAEVEMADPEYSIGYIQITNFSERTYGELVEALEELDSQGMRALIIDLRFNPGGTLNAALQVADLFVADAPLVYLEDKLGNRFPFAATVEGTREPIPMAVLINGSSASASEIVAGALRDNELATLIGTTTFGKGLVQSLYPLRDGSALSITEQGYLTSGGHNINGAGISPDIVVEVTPEEEELIYLGEAEYDAQLEEALTLLRSQL
ncbi:MAG TPA: S41 family peptidase [Firmicutes bacterium]|nr:S41 family peptidase [Bacillota bacterium]